MMLGIRSLQVLRIGLPLFLFLLGKTALLASESQLQAFQELRHGMTAEQVEKVVGAPVQKDVARQKVQLKGQTNDSATELSLTFENGALQEAEATWKIPIDSKLVFESNRRFEPHGPGQRFSHTLPSQWIIGEPEKGQLWWIVNDGGVNHWYLKNPWTPKLPKKTLNEIRALWLSPFRPEKSR